VLTAFNPRNVPYYSFVDAVPPTLKNDEKFSWKVSSQLSSCQMLGNLPETTLVGFASTFLERKPDQIQSVQPLFYSNDKNICGCLLENPTQSRDTKRLQ